MHIMMLRVCYRHKSAATDSHSGLPSSSSKSGGMGEKTAERGPNTAVASVATAVVYIMNGRQRELVTRTWQYI